jgi:hypothetical protein
LAPLVQGAQAADRLLSNASYVYVALKSATFQGKLRSGVLPGLLSVAECMRDDCETIMQMLRVYDEGTEAETDSAEGAGGESRKATVAN